MEFMRSWITNITVVIIFTMLMEILIPNNNMKKFSKVIMGLLIILVIVKPFLLLKGLGEEFQTTIAETAAYIDNSDRNGNQDVEVFQNNTALNIYKQKLIDKVTDEVKKQTDIDPNSVKVNIEIDNEVESKQFGTVKYLHVQASVQKEASVPAATIEPVKINPKTVMNKKQGEYKWSNSKISQDLRAKLRESFGLEDAEVIVEIQE